MKKKSSLKVNLGLAIFSIIIFFFIGELIVSTIWKNTFSQKKFETLNQDGEKVLFQLENGNSFVNGKTKKISVNKEGIRDNDYSLEKGESTRISVIGDSFTFGSGLDDYNDTYPKILETKLNNNSKITYEVINFGNNGANILDIYWTLKYKVIKYNPDIVIYGYFDNDPEFRPENSNPEFCRLLATEQHSFLLEFFDIRLDNMRIKIAKNIDESKFDYIEFLTKKDYYGWDCTKSVIQRMKNLSIEHGFELIIFYIPMPEPNYVNERDWGKVYQIANKEDIVTISEFIYSFWNKLDEEPEYYFIDPVHDQHYNREGHEIIAEVLYDYFKKKTLN